MEVLLQRRLLIVTAIFLLCSMSSVFAQFAGGSGTVHDPYLVQTAAHLNAVRQYQSSHFRQIADIDLNVAPYNQGAGWQPIGDPYSSFSGSYNGSNYTISNLFISSMWSYQGLFCMLNSAVIDSVNLVNVNVEGEAYIGGLAGSSQYSTIRGCRVSGNVSGSTYVGGLIGSNQYDSQVSFCHTSAVVAGEIAAGGLLGENSSSNVTYCSSSAVLQNDLAMMFLGGLIGSNTASTISHCYFSGFINLSYSMKVGGLIGSSETGTTVTNCYSIGRVTGGDDVGGLIGSIYNVTVQNCFATGRVLGSVYTGGLIGYASFSTLTNCYSAAQVTTSAYSTGGLVGTANQVTAYYSYWDTQASGQNYSAAGLGRSTDDMTYPYAANTYENWDFTQVWNTDANYDWNNGYPYLQNLSITNVVLKPVSIPAAGTYYTEQSVALQTNTVNTTIRYATDGSLPDENSAIYTDPIPVVVNTTIKAQAFKNNWLPSPVLTAEYVLKVTAPTFSPPGGVYDFPLQISIQTPTPDAEIHYTLDGSVPTLLSPVYHEPIEIDTICTVKAKAFKSNWNSSEMAYAYYTNIDPSGNGETAFPITSVTMTASPNPFKQNTEIALCLPAKAMVKIDIYNLKGQLVRSLQQDVLSQGEHKFIWDGRENNGSPAAAGIYLCTVKTAQQTLLRKLMLLR